MAIRISVTIIPDVSITFEQLADNLMSTNTEDTSTMTLSREAVHVVRSRRVK